ncbi:MAG: hypothetical protein RL215_2270 [Planctomycetota bacterium]
MRGRVLLFDDRLSVDDVGEVFFESFFFAGGSIFDSGGGPFAGFFELVIGGEGSGECIEGVPFLVFRERAGGFGEFECACGVTEFGVGAGGEEPGEVI